MSIPQMQSLEVGVAVLATQMTEVIKNVKAVEDALDKHREEHERERLSAASARRRLWSAVVVLVASIDGPMLGVLLSSRR